MYDHSSLELRKIPSYQELCDELKIQNINIKGT
jgi:hypothetical protein